MVICKCEGARPRRQDLNIVHSIPTLSTGGISDGREGGLFIVVESSERLANIVSGVIGWNSHVIDHAAAVEFDALIIFTENSTSRRRRYSGYYQSCRRCDGVGHPRSYLYCECKQFQH